MLGRVLHLLRIDAASEITISIENSTLPLGLLSLTGKFSKTKVHTQKELCF